MMLNKKIAAGAFLVAICAFAFALSSCTLFNKGARARVNYLLVSANYLEPRVLCELAQYYSKQPVLMISQADDGDDLHLFYLSNNRKAEEIALANFMDFIDFQNPKVVLFIGNEDYCPKSLVDQASSKYRVMNINCADWEQNAQMLGEIIDQPRLSRQYKDHMEKINEAGNFQIPRK